MRLLLDTCVFLWMISGDSRLPSGAEAHLRDGSNHVWLSSVSNWEISVKESTGRLVLPEPSERYVPRNRLRHQIRSLSMDEKSVAHQGRLPWLHRDPFDRMLICQAIENELTIVTPDHLIRQYPVRTLWD